MIYKSTPTSIRNSHEFYSPIGIFRGNVNPADPAGWGSTSVQQLPRKISDSLDQRLGLPDLRKNMVCSRPQPRLASMGLTLHCLLYPGLRPASGGGPLLHLAAKADFAAGPDAHNGPDHGPFIWASLALPCVSRHSPVTLLGRKSSGLSSAGAFCLGTQNNGPLAAGCHVPAAAFGCSSTSP